MKYLCTCHNEKALQSHKDDRGKPPTCTLGTWSCPVNKKKCKVKRVKE